MKNKRIMVLGSEGKIGKPLCKFLLEKNVKVFSIDLLLGEQFDLREKCELLNYWMPSVDGVFFLAYDFGKSIYSKKEEQNNFETIQNNIKIMSNVFESLNKYKPPFVFTSSLKIKTGETSYEILKCLGELYTKTIGGVNIRLSNVYGPGKTIDLISDFIWKAKNNNLINVETNEKQQFIWHEDCAKSLLSILENYAAAIKYNNIDISSFVWTEPKAIAQIISKYYKIDVVIKNEKLINSIIEPNIDPIQRFWDPRKAVDLETGIHKMIEFYEKQIIIK